MHGPRADLIESESLPIEPVFDPAPQVSRDQLGYLSRESHFEPEIADFPGHRGSRVGNFQRSDRGQPPVGIVCTVGVTAHHSGSSIGKQRIGHDFFGIPTRKEVQRTQLDRTHQHAAARLGSEATAGHLQSIDRPVAAHEPHMSALDGRPQRQCFDERHVDSRRHETRTRHGDQMRDVAR